MSLIWFLFMEVYDIEMAPIYRDVYKLKQHFLFFLQFIYVEDLFAF